MPSHILLTMGHSAGTFYPDELHACVEVMFDLWG